MAYDGGDPEATRLRIQGEKLATREAARLAELAGGGVRSVLDVGCGPGSGAGILRAAFGKHVTLHGIDAHAVLAEKATGTGEYARVFCATVPGADLAERYDVVYCRLMLRHVRDPAAAVAWMRTVTRPGGRIVLADADDATLIFHPPEGAIDGALRRSRALLPWLRDCPTACHAGRCLRSWLAAAGCVDLADRGICATSDGEQFLVTIAMPVLQWGCARTDDRGVPISKGDGSPELDPGRRTALENALLSWAGRPGAFATWTLFYAAGTVP